MAIEEGGSLPVMADAQFCKISVLMPFDNFEDVYQGQPGSYMIAFPGGIDPNSAALQPGYSPKLQLGHPVPIGSRINVGIPICENGARVLSAYRYFFVFRDRNLRDYRDPGTSTRPPYHYPRQGLGAVDHTLAAFPHLFPIDARFNSILYTQTEDTTTGISVGNLYPEAVIPQQLLTVNALAPDGTPVTIQQGIYDPAQIPDARMPMRGEFWLDALGDDMIILAQKVPTGGVFAAWDFAFGSADFAFSNIYGRGGLVAQHDVFRDGGIRVNTGTNP
jgi:hypothetical protein